MNNKVVIGGNLKLKNVVSGQAKLNNVISGTPNMVFRSGGGQLSDAVKEALLDCFEHVAWVDDDGQVYYQALYDALYARTLISITNTLTGCTTSNGASSMTEGDPYSATITASTGYVLTGATVSITMGGVDITSSAYNNGTISIAEVTGSLVITITAVAVTLASISAVYTQSGTVTTSTPLDDLKDDLVVTATYSDSSTATVPSADYTLSGTLTVGTSTITVTYEGKTTTFTVTVSTSPYVTDGLIAYWDGIDNTGSGHSSSATKWTDLVGGYELTLADTTKATWDADAISFNGTVGQGLYCDSFWTRPTNATIEVVLLPSASTTQVVGTWDRSETPLSGSTYDARRTILYADGTVGFVGKSGYTYTSPVSITAIRKMVAEYTDFTVNSCYINGTSLSLSSKTHSFTFTGDPQIRIGVEKLGTSGNIYQFTGKVYAIRVYNRQLTSEELAKNLNYDNTRFNLELNNGKSDMDGWADGVAYTDLEIVQNEYVNNNNGNFTSYNGWNRTGYVPINGASTLSLPAMSGSGGDTRYNAFYTENHAFISAFNIKHGTSVIQTVPATAYYFVLSETAAGLAEILNSGVVPNA